MTRLVLQIIVVLVSILCLRLMALSARTRRGRIIYLAWVILVNLALAYALYSPQIQASLY